jgi:1-acyl-sn-glycerol-3-phosphate acyltransferase
MAGAAGAAQPRRTRTGLAGTLRIAARLAVMLGWFALCVMLYHLCRWTRIANPWPRRFLAGIAAIAGVRTERAGKTPHRGSFLLSNHVSWLDIPLLAGATGAAFVAHDGIASVPFLRWLCAMNDTVFVARHDRASVAAQVEQVRAALDDTGALAIFPEGTTSDGTGLLPFKSSLLSALMPVPEGIEIVPVLVDYGAESTDIAWIGEEPGLANFLRILARGRILRASVTFLPALTGEALSTRKTIAAAAQAAIEDEQRRRRSGQRVAL